MGASPRAWVLCTGEPLPTDPGTPRIHRAGLLCEYLHLQGWEVDFWTSNFNHFTKTHRVPAPSGTISQTISPRFRIHLLPSRGYTRHVSLARIQDHREIAKAFTRTAPGHPSPDILIISMPTIDLAHAGARFAKSKGIPYILDLRDLWPEIFYLGRATPVRQVIQILTRPWSVQLNWALRNADSVVGITDAFVAWGLMRSGMTERAGIDQAFPLAYPDLGEESDAEVHEREKLTSEGKLRPDQFQLAYIGSVSTRMDIETLLKAVDACVAARAPIHLVVAGDGEALAGLRATYQSSHIQFLGWVDQTTLRAVLRTSRAGVVPYRNSLDFQMSIPNKVIEYLAAGLPVITPIKGILSQLINTESVGMTYDEGNPSDLKERILCFSQTAGLVEEASRKASILFQQRFSTNVVFKNYYDLIAKITDR